MPAEQRITEIEANLGIATDTIYELVAEARKLKESDDKTQKVMEQIADLLARLSHQNLTTVENVARLYAKLEALEAKK